MLEFLLQFTVTLGSLLIYALPAIVAYRRRHHQRLAILLLNLLLGSTGIGWIAALVWAGTAVKPSVD